MSGIAACLRLDGGPAEAGRLDLVLDALAAMGPDGRGCVADGPALIGHRLLATTPESLHEPMPFHHRESGCVLTADLRLDNRESLIAQFGLTGARRMIGDGELVLQAWLRWGEDCPEHLLGDFAFALWDPRSRRLFAARDHMGMKPLVWWHAPGQAFGCASSARSLLHLPGLPVRLNELRLAEYLIDFKGNDDVSTYFVDVWRLLPGHCLTVSDKGVSTRCYWRQEPVEPVFGKTDAAYADGLREVLTEAVQARLRCNGQVGSMLSGGMDSGSVSALAARLLSEQGREPLATYSITGPGPSDSAEARGIDAAIRLPGLDPTLIDHAQLDPALKQRILTLCHSVDEPLDYTVLVQRSAYAAAQQAGVKVVLDGAAGDVVLYEGSLVYRLIRSGHLRRAWHEQSELAEVAGMDHSWAKREYRKALRSALVPFWGRQLRRAWNGRVPPGLPNSRILDPDFARRAGLIESQQIRDTSGIVRNHDNSVRRVLRLNGSISFAREILAWMAADAGVEARDPFLDQRVIQYCLALPQDQLIKDGWPKLVLRRAMKGILPEEVCWMRGKGHLGKHLFVALMNPTDWWKDLLRDNTAYLSDRVDSRFLVEALQFERLEHGQFSDLNDTAYVTALAAFFESHKHLL
ncbi:asparagine synthase-related protein [Tropicimonas sp. TH_r6]|uniref:asparagine synthase-related protein n=1 Tax=Tropicimonas sp. TH_r6 TaxID=3082085 RepID=UPI002953AB31|nr:asparagine synthase-related protein [Tropicimonas sp. TH_r6]MDV7141324.1 asparagine synthase-related protein [Tropicimonas sp. TH_r6]